MYSMRGYAAMIHDRRRVEAYQRALELAVKPDSVVVDIGTGLGIIAFLACQAGARIVYAIEPSAVVHVARQLATVNGYGQRVIFIEDMSTCVTLPEKADVIVSDMGGALPLYHQHIPSIVDARKRLLKPHGILIPRSDTVWAGVVNAPEIHAKIVPRLDFAPGLDMRPAWQMAANVFSNTRFKESQLVTAPQRLVTLDYSSVDDPNLHAQVTCEVMGPGTGHGISLWFERIMADGISYSTAPGEPEMVYGGLFLPWPEAVELDPSDTVELQVRADLRSENYVWSWNTTISTAAGIKHKFRQSDFLGEARSPARLRKQAATYVPTLNANGEIDRLILDLMDGRNANGDIAREAHQRFGARFPALEDAMGYVADLSLKYSR
jgi:protein arginine N-methyltransferase 1